MQDHTCITLPSNPELAIPTVAQLTRHVHPAPIWDVGGQEVLTWFMHCAQVNRRELLAGNALSMLLPLCLTVLRQLLHLEQPPQASPQQNHQSADSMHMSEEDLLVLLEVLELLAADAGDTSSPVRRQVCVRQSGSLGFTSGLLTGLQSIGIQLYVHLALAPEGLCLYHCRYIRLRPLQLLPA